MTYFGNVLRGEKLAVPRNKTAIESHQHLLTGLCKCIARHKFVTFTCSVVPNLEAIELWHKRLQQNPYKNTLKCLDVDKFTLQC